MTSPQSSLSDDEEVCTTCGQTLGWHKANNPRHEFNGPLKVEKPKTVVGAAPQWPFDPVLRQALVDKGILTVQDLADAEAKIRAVSGLPTGGGQ